MNKAKLKQAFTRREKLVKDFNLFMKLSHPAAQRILDKPELMKGLQMKRAEKFFNLPKGTIFKMVTGELDYEQFDELLCSTK